MVLSTLNSFNVLSSMVDVKVGEGCKTSAFGSPSTTSLAARINELESQMLDEKLVLLGDDGKPLKPCKSKLPMKKGGFCDMDM